VIWHAPAVEVRRVDPRDVEWEFDHPYYRVHFWSQHGPGAWRCDEHELSGCDVAEAISWADANAGAGRSYTLYASILTDGNVGLVRLAGVDPTRAS
jgi:hypothetical protein